MSNGFQYLPALDGLRGISIIAVFLFHLRVPGFGYGFIGVDIFFLISGYLITSLLLAEYDQCGAISLKNFYLRRALRLLPALAAMLVSVCIWSVFAESPDYHLRNLKAAIIALFYSTNLVLGVYGFDYLGPYAHTWSLSVEEQFYVFWPIALILMLRRGWSRRRIIAGLLIVIACLVAFHLYANFSDSPRMHRLAVSRPEIILIGCAFACSRYGKPLRLPRIFENRALIYVGALSYSLYLWHYPAFYVVISRHLPNIKEQFAIAALAIACSLASYYLIERPYLRFKERLSSSARSG